ncbi:hypothetical protein EJ02DRAFT_460713, partial [Clathrospora elynae]
ASSTHKRQTVDSPTQEVSGRYICAKNKLLIQADAGLHTSVSRRPIRTTTNVGTTNRQGNH